MNRDGEVATLRNPAGENGRPPSSQPGGSAVRSIGRIKAYGRWRAADEPATDADRRALLMALTREAEEYGADALVEVRFEADETAEIDGVSLRRLVATGAAVRTAQAA